MNNNLLNKIDFNIKKNQSHLFEYIFEKNNNFNDIIKSLCIVK